MEPLGQGQWRCALSVSLRSWRSSTPIALADAIHVWASRLDGAIGLLYSPSECRVARFTPAAWIGVDGPMRADDVFECRCFNADIEFRWLQNAASADATGTAVVLSEGTVVVPEGWVALDALTAVETIEQLYLVWGEVATTTDGEGFVTLEAARVGRLSVPYDGEAGRGERLGLRAREYVCVEVADDGGPFGDESVFGAGNAFVAEERLMGFASAPRPERPGDARSGGHGGQ